MSDSEENKILNMGIAAVFMAYAIFIFILGAWGNSVLPDSCQNQTLRSSIRGMIVTGAITATAMVGYIACGVFCQSNTVEIIPNWFLVFMFAISITNLVMASKIQSELSSDDPCYTGKSETFKNMNSYGIMTSVVTLILSIIILGYRGYSQFQIKKEKYNQYLSKANQQTKEKQRQAELEKQSQSHSAEIARLKAENEKAQIEASNLEELNRLKEQQRNIQAKLANAKAGKAPPKQPQFARDDFFQF